MKLKKLTDADIVYIDEGYLAYTNITGEYGLTLYSDCTEVPLNKLLEITDKIAKLNKELKK